MLSYSEISSKSWSEILSDNLGGHTSPHVVHLPIHPPFSADFVHLDGALNVCRRRVIPGLNVNEWSKFLDAQKKELLLVQFALGSKPFVPDFTRAKITLSDDGTPSAQIEHFVPTGKNVEHSGLLYRFEYSCCFVDGPGQSLLSIRCTVENKSPREQKAHVWTKVCFPKEEEIFEYHYVPFYWDQSKYRPSELSGFQDQSLLRAGAPIGHVKPDGFKCEWIKSLDFQDSDYEGEASSLFVVPSLRYKNVRDAIHLQTKILPGETRAFEISALVNYENIAECHLAFSKENKFTTCHQKLVDYCRAIPPLDKAELICPAGDWGNIFTHLPLSTEQLMVESSMGLIPTQGGSSERHFVWVWEAVFMLMPMLQLGYFELVQRALEYIFSLQDAGSPPRGRLVSTEGAVGTTGPKWLTTTGAALALASECYRYSGDKEFLEAFLPRIRKAVNWILKEIRATRVLDSNGKRPSTYGLMPFGHATDCDVGHIIAFTDAYTFWGLEKSVRMFEDLQDEFAGELRKELEEYRRDIQTAVAGITREDGFIDRKVITGDADEKFHQEFEVACGAFNLGVCGAVDPNSESFRHYQNYVEKNHAFGPFLGRSGHEVVYLGIAEWAWQDIYLQRGEWKKAFLTTKACTKYGLTSQGYQMQERFSLTDPAFCAWQPNGSGNGRTLDMIIKSFWFEYNHAVVLLGGVPFAWLRQNGLTELKNLRTHFGLITLTVKMLDSQSCECRVIVSPGGNLPSEFTFPDHFRAVHSASDENACSYILNDLEP